MKTAWQLANNFNSYIQLEVHIVAQPVIRAKNLMTIFVTTPYVGEYWRNDSQQKKGVLCR